MKSTLNVLNELENHNVISSYAIGGAIALLFYIEPVLTYDLDVFVFLPSSELSLISLTPLYEYLKNKGYSLDREHVMIENLPVQFIPAYNSLVEEATRLAKVVPYEDIKTRVLSLEYLTVIMLQTGRPKDFERIAHVIESNLLDLVVLESILEKFNLKDKWEKTKLKYTNEL